MGFLRRLLGQGAADDGQSPPSGVPPELEDHRVEIPSEGIELYAGGGGVDVVGESNYRDVLVGLTGGQRREGVKQYLTAALVPEPTNRYDSNAVSVRIDGQVVGYLSRPDAVRYRPVFDRLLGTGRVAYCSAQVRAGWDRGGGDRGDFSVTVYIDSPERQMALLTRELK